MLIFLSLFYLLVNATSFKCAAPTDFENLCIFDSENSQFYFLGKRGRAVSTAFAIIKMSNIEEMLRLNDYCSYQIRNDTELCVLMFFRDKEIQIDPENFLGENRKHTKFGYCIKRIMSKDRFLSQDELDLLAIETFKEIKTNDVEPCSSKKIVYEKKKFKSKHIDKELLFLDKRNDAQLARELQSKYDDELLVLDDSIDKQLARELQSKYDEELLFLEDSSDTLTARELQCKYDEEMARKLQEKFDKEDQQVGDEENQQENNAEDQQEDNNRDQQEGDEENQQEDEEVVQQDFDKVKRIYELTLEKRMLYERIKEICDELEVLNED